MVSQPLFVVIVAGDCPGRCRVFSSILGFPDGSAIKNLIVKQETWVQSLGREDPLEVGMEFTPVFLPGKSHGQRSLVGYSPWGRKELDAS